MITYACKVCKALEEVTTYTVGVVHRHSDEGVAAQKSYIQPLKRFDTPTEAKKWLESQK